MRVDFTELRLDLDAEWESPLEEPITVQRPYTDLELAYIQEMRERRAEERAT